MKARIRQTVPETVLSYGLAEETARKLTAVLEGLFISERRIAPDEVGKPLGFLAGFPGFPEHESGEAAPDCGGMICLGGLSSARIDVLLAALREEQIAIPLKAVITPVNRNWSVAKLIAELGKEREAIARQRQNRAGE